MRTYEYRGTGTDVPVCIQQLCTRTMIVQISVSIYVPVRVAVPVLAPAVPYRTAVPVPVYRSMRTGTCTPWATAVQGSTVPGVCWESTSRMA